MPICGRCRKSRADCQYTPSRRGYKTATRSQAGGEARSATASVTSPQSSSRSLSSPLQTVGLSQPGLIALQETTSPTPLHGLLLATVSQAPLPQTPLVGADGQPTFSSLASLLDYYFMFFHDALPILPPRHLVHRLAPIPPCLEAVMNFVGSHYAYGGESSGPYRALAAATLANDLEPSFFKVQALLIYAVVLHAIDERPAAVQSFDEAAQLALKLGMNRKTFAEHHGGDDLVREESMRRTWWALYVLDGMFAGFDQSTFKIDKFVVIDSPLPSEDLSYSTGVYVREPPTLTQFRDRVFEDEAVEFSSFCYTVEAGHLLRRALSLTSPFDEQAIDQVEAIEASISSWFHSLPDLKPHVLQHDGTIDEMLFLAYMLVHCASIYLHLPRCNLLSTPAASASIACARRGPYLPPTALEATHATKAVQAANGIANLASLSTSLVKHTPFFICGLVLSGVVQLAACSVRASKSLEPRRDRIALIIGNLKMLNRTWCISRQVMKHIKMVAREVLEIGIRPTEYLEAEDSGPDVTSLVSNDMWLGDIEIDGAS